MGLLGHDGEEKIVRVCKAAAAFDTWATGDDPYGEHDFGKFEVDDEAFLPRSTITVWMRPTAPSIRRIRPSRSG